MTVKKPTEQEKRFCKFLSIYRIPETAAALAGYKNPKKAVKKLLLNESITKYLKRNDPSPETSEIEAGLRRLAFGSGADIIRLVSAENISALPLDEMDLMLISEIKIPRDGCIEIKLHDRQKALEKLLEIKKESASDPSDSFFKALEAGAKALESEEEQ